MGRLPYETRIAPFYHVLAKTPKNVASYKIFMKGQLYSIKNINHDN